MKLPEFVKYGKIEEVNFRDLGSILRDKELEVFEKLDGGNCQIRKINGQLYAGSKANYLKGSVVSRREWFSRLVNWMHSNVDLYNLPEDTIIFGEWGGHHTISYDPEFVDDFHVIDVYDMSSKKFWEYKEGISLLRDYSIHSPKEFQVLKEGKLRKRDLVSLLRQPSFYYDGLKEGLVLKDYENQEFFKLLRPEFSEKRDKAFGQVDYLTEARFIKNAEKFFGEKDLPHNFNAFMRYVIKDVYDETNKKMRPVYVEKKAFEVASQSNQFRGYLADIIGENWENIMKQQFYPK